MDPILNDKRFAKLATDKKFRSVGKKHKKVEIDKRFGALFTNKNFVSKCTVDKRGRPKNLSAKESYEKFYQLEDDSSSDDDQEEDEDNDNQEEEDEVSDNEEKESEEEREEERKPVSKADINKKIKSKLLSNDVDYARGEGNLYSDSSSEEDSDSDEAGGNVEDDLNDDEDPGSEYFDKWGELDADSERTEEATERLALCNMDWDRVGAEDIYLLLSSFCPPSGSITNVKIFLSGVQKYLLLSYAIHDQFSILNRRLWERAAGGREGDGAERAEEAAGRGLGGGRCGPLREQQKDFHEGRRGHREGEAVPDQQAQVLLRCRHV